MIRHSQLATGAVDRSECFSQQVLFLGATAFATTGWQHGIAQARAKVAGSNDMRSAISPTSRSSEFAFLIAPLWEGFPKPGSYLLSLVSPAGEGVEKSRVGETDRARSQTN